MELYCRKVSLFDQKIVDDFALEFKNNNENSIPGDCSLILNKSYLKINNFYKWYKKICHLEKKKAKVPCSCYLVFRKEDDYLIGIFDLRHSLNFKHGNIYGHVGVSIRPSQREKGYYKHILHLIIEKAKEISINPLVISTEYDNIVSYKGIENIFGKYKDMVLVDNTYYYVFQKNLK